MRVTLCLILVTCCLGASNCWRSKPKCLDLAPAAYDWDAAVAQAFADQESIATVDVFDPNTEVDTVKGAAAIIGCDPR